MKILVIGSGGQGTRNHKKLKENLSVTEVFAAPGNGGIASDAECVDISACDIDSMTGFAVKNEIDYCVVTPDDPLVLGMVDAMEAKGTPCFGPRKNAAIIEGGKIFQVNTKNRRLAACFFVELY